MRFNLDKFLDYVWKFKNIDILFSNTMSYMEYYFTLLVSVFCVYLIGRLNQSSLKVPDIINILLNSLSWADTIRKPYQDRV